MNWETLPPPEQVDPQRLTVLLKEAGWRLVGSRQGFYNRFAPPGSDDDSLRGSLLVPLNRSDPHFAEIMTSALLEVSNRSPREIWQQVILPRLRVELVDQFLFRKETSTPGGLIPWKQGEDLIAAARATLVAGAKTYVSKRRRFSNRLGQFAGRFLDSVLMGQTAVGSYIVTAYAPTESEVPVFANSIAGLGLFGVDVARGRAITRSVANALEATVEAVEHYRTTRSFSGFDAGVDRGISFDLSTALQGLIRNSPESEICLQWEQDVELFLESPSTTFEFIGSDVDILERAAVHLSTDEDTPSRELIVGRVHLLTKKLMGEPGVFGMETMNAPHRRVRVRLADAEQYHRAVRAHDEDLVLAVEGTLERDGNLFWLYGADVKAELGSVSEFFDQEPFEMFEIPGQSILLDDAGRLALEEGD